jgi:hypothetical protein
MRYAIAIVFLVPNVIANLCGLIGIVFIAWAYRLKPHRLITACEYLHHIGHYALDNILHIG